MAWGSGMLTGIVIDALDVERMERFWRDATQSRTGGLQLRFVPTATPKTAHKNRLHFDLAGGPEWEVEVARLLALGATRVDIGQGNVPWDVLADPEGNEFCVLRPGHPGALSAPASLRSASTSARRTATRSRPSGSPGLTGRRSSPTTGAPAAPEPHQHGLSGDGATCSAEDGTEQAAPRGRASRLGTRRVPRRRRERVPRHVLTSRLPLPSRPVLPIVQSDRVAGLVLGDLGRQGFRGAC